SILSFLPPNVHLISHVHPKAALDERAPIAKTPGRGARRKKGHWLPSMAQWTKDVRQPWTELEFNQFGLHASLAVKTMKALYYTVGGDRKLTIVLVHDLEGNRPDQMFYCTKLDWKARQILTAYSYCWAIECTFESCKQFLGLEDPANRLQKAVERAAPKALLIYSLVVIWFHKAGYRFVSFPNRPWYRRKQEPSFADLLTTLRRVSLEEKSRSVLPNQRHTKTWLAQI